MSLAGEDGKKSQQKQKSSKALRTIGEASEMLGVPQHVLRFWEEKFTRLNPKKHRGRRYYSPDDLELLSTIKHLLYNEGYKIKGVQKALASNASGKKISTPSVEASQVHEQLASAGLVPDPEAIQQYHQDQVGHAKRQEALKGLLGRFQGLQKELSDLLVISRTSHGKTSP